MNLLGKIIVILFCLHSSFHALAAFNIPNGNDQMGRLSRAAEDNESVTQSRMIEADPAKYCEMNMALRYINANPEAAAGTSNVQCNEMSLDQLRNHLDKTFRRADDLSPWTTSLIQAPAAQNFSLIKTSGIDASFDQAANGNFFKKALLKIRQELEKPPELVLKQIDDIKFLKLSIGERAGFFSKSMLCADLSLIDTLGCSRSLSKAIEIAVPYRVQIDKDRATLFAPINAWRRALDQEAKYVEGLRLASIGMIERLSTASNDASNVLSDLIDSFGKAGMSLVEAENAAFDTLALYGNGGANLGFRAQSLCKANCEGIPGLPYYLEIIGKAIPRLDFERAKNGMPLYSWPRGVTGFCNTQKSYHFWMSAYLSREIAKFGGDPKFSILGTYAAAIGYQLNRELGRTGDSRENQLNRTLSRTSYDPVVNVMRADLAYAAAGAKFGVQYGRIESSLVSIDNILTKMVMQSSNSSNDRGFLMKFEFYEKVINYGRLKTLIAPNAAIEN